MEFADFVPLEEIGGIIVKGTTLEPREGNDYPRMAETPQGMLNCVGLQNKGVEYFCEHIYPQIKDIDTNMIVNVSGHSPESYAECAARVNELDKIPATGLTQGPLKPPVRMLSSGWRFSISTAIPIRVLMSETESAPSASTARAMSAMLVTLGEMGTGAMGVMDQKFGSAAAAYSYLIFVLLYVPCISVMGAIARESSRGWMGFSILWGLNIAYSLATLFYQVASYSQHPTYSLVCILAVILFNIVVIGLLRRARSRVDIELLATRKSVSSCCAASTTGDCH